MRLAALLAFLLVVGTGVCRAANPSYADFGTNQFTNVGVSPILKVNVSSNALLTNPIVTSITVLDSVPGNSNLNIRGGVAYASNALGLGVWNGDGFSQSNTTLFVAPNTHLYKSMMAVSNGALVEAMSVGLSIGGFPHAFSANTFHPPAWLNYGTNMFLVGAGSTNGWANLYMGKLFADGSNITNLTTASGFTNAATNILYVHPNGLATGIRGNPFAPWNNLSNAMVACTNGDTIIVSGSNTISPIGFFVTSQMNAALLLRQKSNVTIRGFGNDAEIHGDGTGNFMVLEDTANVTIENLSFTGNRPLITGGNLFLAIGLSGTNSRTTVQNNHFANLGDHVIGVGRNVGNGLKNHSTALISGNLFVNCGGGIAGSDADGVCVQPGRDGWVIINNIITNCFRGVEFQGDFLNSSSNHIVANNFIHTYEDAVCILETADGTNQYRNIRITDNMMISGSGTNLGVNMNGCSDCEISRNSIDGFNYGINLGNGNAALTNLLVLDNVVLRSVTSGILAVNQTNRGFVLQGNQFRENTLVAVELQFINDGLVDGNVATDNGSTTAFQLSSSTGVRFLKNSQNGLKYAETQGLIINSTCTNTLLSGNSFESNVVASGVADSGINTRIFNHQQTTNIWQVSSGLWQNGTNVVSTNVTITGTSSTLTPPTTNWWTLTGTNPSGIPFPVILSWVPGMTNVASATLPTRSPIQTNIPNGTTNQFTFGMLYTNTGPKSMFHARVQITAGATTDAHARLMISNSAFGTAFTEIDSVGTPAATGVVGVTNWLSGIIDTGEFFYVTNDNGVVMTTNTPNWYFRQQ